MKKLKSNIANMAIVLTLIAVLAAGALAWVNDETSGPIEEINNAAIENGIKSVILGDRDIEFTVESPREQDGFVFHNVNDRVLQVFLVCRSCHHAPQNRFNRVVGHLNANGVVGLVENLFHIHLGVAVPPVAGVARRRQGAIAEMG